MQLEHSLEKDIPLVAVCAQPLSLSWLGEAHRQKRHRVRFYGVAIVLFDAWHNLHTLYKEDSVSDSSSDPVRCGGSDTHLCVLFPVASSVAHVKTPLCSQTYASMPRVCPAYSERCLVTWIDLSAGRRPAIPMTMNENTTLLKRELGACTNFAEVLTKGLFV